MDRLRFPLAFAVLALLTLPAVAEEIPAWTGHLGPNRDAAVPGFDVPSEWPEELRSVWSIEVGAGYAAPLVSGGRVYQHARQGDSEVLLCLDRKSGEELWRTPVAVPFRIRGGGQKHGAGPKSTPVLVGSRVATVSIDGVLRCFDAASGELQWTKDVRETFPPGHPHWGASTSPTTDGDRIYVHLGSDKAGRLAALDPSTGEEVWSITGTGASYSSPILATFDGVPHVVQWDHLGLTGVDVRNGMQLWTYPLAHRGSDQNMPTPVLAGETILLGAENRGLRAVHPRLKAGKWEAIATWERDDLALNMSSAVLSDGKLYGLSHYDSGRLFCLDAKDGNTLWQGPPRAGSFASFLTVPGYLLALMQQGELKVIPLQQGSDYEYKEAQSYTLSDAMTWTQPVPVAGGLLIKAGDTLTRWTFDSE